MSRAAFGHVGQWLAYNSAYTKDNEETTHLNMTNGRIRIDYGMQDKFLTELQKDMNSDIDFFFVEKHSTPVFPMYWDFDFELEMGLTEEDVQDIACLLCSTIREFYPSFDDYEWESRSICVISTCDEKTEVLYKGRSFFKSGVHITMPNLFVETSQAESLAQYASQCFTALKCIQIENVEWDKVIDRSVYEEGKSLRMMGSKKPTPCTECGRRSSGSKQCSNCNGKGFNIDGDGRRYKFLMCMDGFGKREQTLTNRASRNQVVAWLFASIRADPEIAKNTDAVRQFFVHPRNFLATSSPGSHARKNNSGGNEISFPDPSYNIIRDFVRSLNPQWNNINLKISAQKRNNVNIRYLCKAGGCGSTYCTNVGRAHKSNGIYFVMVATGLTQSCYSKKVCTGFKSNSFELPSDVRAALFDNLQVNPSICLEPSLEQKRRMQAEADISTQIPLPVAKRPRLALVCVFETANDHEQELDSHRVGFERHTNPDMNLNL